MEARVPRFQPIAEMEPPAPRRRRVGERGDLAKKVCEIIHEWDAIPTEERYLVARCDDSTETLRIYQTVQNVCASRPLRDTDYTYAGHKRGNNVYIERKGKRKHKWL